MSRPERYLVIGCGGIGGVVAAHLSDSGRDVTVLARNGAAHDALARDGLRLVGHSTVAARCRVVAAMPSAPEWFDYVLLAVQPPEVEAAARDAAALLGPSGRIVCFQNGLCEERVARIVGRERVIGGIIAWGASVSSPGVIERTSRGGFTVGALSDTSADSVRRLSDALESIGPVSVTDNLTGARWSKLAINCAVSTLGTIGGNRLGDLLRHRRVRRLGLEIVTEALEVADAEGVYVEPLAGTVRLERLSLRRRRKPRLAVDLLGKHLVLVAIGMRYRRLRSSMLAAIERGRTPAVDFLNGEVVDRGAKHHVSTPVNQAALDTVWAIARGQVRPSLETLEALYARTR